MHIAGETQPGGRVPAPGQLGVLQAFLNTFYDLESHGGDVFANPAALEAWLSSQGLLGRGRVRAGEDDLRRTIAMREALRALARANGDASGARTGLNRAAHGASVEIRFEPEGPRFLPAHDAGVDGALGVLLAIAAQAMIEGSWARLKICPGEHCGWAFYDHSRNQSGRWCSMAVCGGRAKARAHYQRQRGRRP